MSRQVRNFQTSCCGKPIKRREVFPACAPRCAAILPKLHGLAYSSLVVSPFLYFRAFALLEKKKQIPFIADSLRTGARHQGRRSEPFIGAKRKPLREQARDRAQPPAEKGICGGPLLIVHLNQGWCTESFAWVLTCCTYPLVSPAVGDPLL